MIPVYQCDVRISSILWDYHVEKKFVMVSRMKVNGIYSNFNSVKRFRPEKEIFISFAAIESLYLLSLLVILLLFFIFHRYTHRYIYAHFVFVSLIVCPSIQLSICSIDLAVRSFQMFELRSFQLLYKFHASKIINKTKMSNSNIYL